MSKKPSFLKYIIHQNNDYFKVTGVIHSDSSDLLKEVKYFRNKFIIDSILNFMSIIILSFGVISLANVVVNFLQNFLNGDTYNPNIGFETLAIIISILIVLEFIWFIVIPIIMKIIRSLFGLRWCFVRFENVNNNKLDQKGNVDSPLDYYNNKVAFQCDRVFYRKSKNLEEIINSEYNYEETNSLKTIKVVFHSYMKYIIPILALTAFIDIESSIKVIICGTLVALILCLLSLVITVRYKK